MKRHRAGPAKNSAYVCIAACGIVVVWGRNPTSSCAVQIHYCQIHYYNVWNGIVMALHKKTACTFVLLCVWSIAVEGVVGFWYSMTSYFTLTCYFAVQMHYVSSCWPWTNSAYVCISVCICSNLKVLLIGVRCSMVFRFHPCVSFCCPTVMTALRLSLFLAECVERSDVVLALNQQWWCMTTPCWSSLIECMERPAVVLALYKQIVRFCRCCSYVSLTTLEGVT